MTQILIASLNIEAQILIKSLRKYEISPRPQSAQSDNTLSEFMNPAFLLIKVHSSYILTISCVSLWSGGPADCWTLWDSCTADCSPWKQSMFVLLAGGVTGEMSVRLRERTSFSVTKALCLQTVWYYHFTRGQNTIPVPDSQLCIYDSGWLSLCWTVKH